MKRASVTTALAAALLAITIPASASAAAPQPVRVGALYFGSFNAERTDIIEQTQSVYGRPGDWWGGVRDFSGLDPAVPMNRWLWPNDDFSHLKPAIGYYDDSKVSTVEAHIAQAASAGLSYFSFYWYWNGLEHREYLSSALRAFLQARNSADLDFTVGVCAHAYASGRLTIPKSDFGPVTQILANYLTVPNALKTADGRPIVELCDTRGIGSGSAADVRAFVDALRNAVRQKAGKEIMVLAHSDLVLDRPAAGVDGLFCGARVESVGTSYARYANEHAAYLDSLAGSLVRCLMSDFDERPRYPTSITDPAQVRYFTDQTPELFSKSIAAVRDDLATSTRPAAVDDLVQIYAWNEWHEGGIIEPNARDGCLYLNLIQSGLGLSAKGCGQPPVVTLEARKKQKSRALRKKGIQLRVSCDEACTVDAHAALRPKKKLGEAAATGTFIAAGAQATIEMKLSKKQWKKIARRLRSGKKVRAAVEVTATDLAGDAAGASAKVRIVRRSRR